MNNQLLREIPKVDDLLRSPTLASVCADIPHGALVEAVRGVLAAKRSLLRRARRAHGGRACLPCAAL